MSNPIAQMDHSILEGLRHLDSLCTQSGSDEFFQNVLTKIWPTLSGVTEKPTTEALDKMCGKFHAMSTDKNFTDEIENYLSESGIKLDKPMFLIQCFLEGLTKTILKKNSKRIRKHI